MRRRVPAAMGPVVRSVGREAGTGPVWRPPRGGIGCWLVLPPRPVPDRRPLVVVHGIRRGARQHAGRFGPAARALGRPLVAPLFEPGSWPRYQRAVTGGRADLALLALMAALEGEGTLLDGERFDLFGFSGGAQFAHRFAMLHPERVGQLSLASAGWYTFPDAAPFPYGLGGDGWGRRAGERQAAFLAIPTRVFVGANDVARDRNLRQGAGIDAQQGRTRVERARRWTAARNQAARAHCLEPATSLHLLSDCDHSFARCAAAGLVTLVTEPPPPVAPAQPTAMSRMAT